MLLRADLRQRGVDLGGGKLQRFGRDAGPVESVGQFDQRRIAPRAHIGDDAAHHLGDIFLVFALGEEQFFEIGGEDRIAGVQAARHFRRSPS